jgi:pimeloyl-ACP methyl ester carboxylesterase
MPTCFVRTVEPDEWNGRTVVMVHGWMHSGEHYVRTIDGRPGWSGDFAAAGYRVLVPDWPGIGRSPAVEPSSITAAFNVAGLAGVVESAEGPVDLLVHSMSGPYGYTLLESHGELIDNLVAVAPAPPPELATRPDRVEDLGEVIRAVYGAVEIDTPKRADWMQPELGFVVDKVIAGAPQFPDIDPADYLRTLVPMWSGLGHEHLANVSTPPDPHYVPAPLPGKRVLVVTGTHDRDHPREADARVADWLRSRRAAVTHLYLGDCGIDGNSHVSMLDRNSAQVAALIIDWLQRRD